MSKHSIGSISTWKHLRWIPGLAVFVFASAASADPVCGASAAVTAGDSPEAIATVDLDGDAVPDIVTANAFSDDVGVMLGNGDGTFQPAVAHAAGNSPRAIAVGLLDGDTVPDVVTANFFSGDLTVLIGNGDGTLQAPVAYPAGNSPTAVAVGDVNGDGKADLVNANLIHDQVRVHLGNGDGTFQAAVPYAAGNGPRGVVLAALDAGATLDIATADSIGGAVTVLLGNGDGTFGAKTTFAAGGAPFAVAADDVDGDGALDLLTANAFSDDVSVLLGNGNGTFQAAVGFAAGDSPRGIAVADLDGDSALDVVTANAISDDVSVLLGNGDGTFGAPESCAAGDSPRGVAAADFDGNTVPDFASANAFSDDVTVISNLSEPMVTPVIVSIGRQAAQPDGEAYEGTPLTVSDAVDLGSAMLGFDLLTANGFNQDLDALCHLPNGNVLFSAEPWIFGLPDVGNVHPGDIVEYDALVDTYSIYFSANEFVGQGNVDACTILPNGNLVLSNKGPGQLPGIGAFQDGDLVEWDGLSGSLFLAESAIFTAGANNGVDAVHDTGDTILISPRTDGIGEIGSNGLMYHTDSSDVFEIDLGTGEATRLVDGENLWESGNTRQVDAVAIEPPATCPCWTDEEIDQVAFPNTQQCFFGRLGVVRMRAQGVTNPPQLVAVARAARLFPPAPPKCMYDVNDPFESRHFDLTPAQGDACLDSLTAECEARGF